MYVRIKACEDVGGDDWNPDLLKEVCMHVCMYERYVCMHVCMDGLRHAETWELMTGFTQRHMYICMYVLD